MDRLRRLFIVCVICVIGSDAQAQAPPPTLTIGNLATAASQAATSANLAASNPQANDALSTALATLRDARVLDQEIPTFVREYTSPDAIALAHRRQHQYTPAIKTAIDTIKGVANGLLAPGGGLTPELTNAVVQLQDAEQKAGLVWDIETLRLLERKYGPGSAKLNGVEVGAAYLTQRWAAFGVNKGGRPGPFEVVLAYFARVHHPIGRRDEARRRRRGRPARILLRPELGHRIGPVGVPATGIRLVRDGRDRGIGRSPAAALAGIASLRRLFRLGGAQGRLDRRPGQAVPGHPAVPVDSLGVLTRVQRFGPVKYERLDSQLPISQRPRSLADSHLGSWRLRIESYQRSAQWQ